MGKLKENHRDVSNNSKITMLDMLKEIKEF